MKYVGSKNRISKYIVPIIQSYIGNETKGYIEPFVGGANVIDKISAKKKIGCDVNPYLIALLRKARDEPECLPDTISYEEYCKVFRNKERYEKWYVGLVGFCSTYGAKWFGGYARAYKPDGVTPRDMPAEGIRNLKKQSRMLKGITFKCCSYTSIPKTLSGYVMYCDPPYRGATKYRDAIDYQQFYRWVREMSKHNVVLVSEYSMPNDFRCIWSKKHETILDVKEHKERVERLWIYDGAVF